MQKTTSDMNIPAPMQKANAIKSIPVHKASQCPNKRYMLATMKTNCSQKATKRIKKTAEENKVENISDGFEKDQSPQTLNAVFKGKLKASLSSDGIFTLKGRIKLTKNEIEKPATEKL